MFDNTNEIIGDSAITLSQTPLSFNPAVFDMIRNLSEIILLPIGGMVLTYVLTYELIQMITEKNNMADFDTFNLYKWVFKTWIAVFIMANMFDIIMAIFDLASSAINAAAGMVIGNLDLGSPAMMAQLEILLEDAGLGELLGLFFQSFLVGFIMNIISVIIFIVVVGRMMEIYITISLAPIPLATLVNREWSSMGNNYLKALFAVAFQGFLMMVCLAIYAVLIASVVTANSVNGALFQMLGYTALVCFMLLKTGGISKSIFNAH